MSMDLINLARRFSNSVVSAEAFADTYIAQWSNERDTDRLKHDETNISECASSIFVLADSFNPDASRRESELDEKHLKLEVQSTLRKFNLD